MRVRHDFRLIELSKVSNAVLSVGQPVTKITHCSVSSQFRPKKPSETILKEILLWCSQQSAEYHDSFSKSTAVLGVSQ